MYTILYALMENFILIIKRYSNVTIFLAIAIIIFTVYFTKNQNINFLIAGILALLGSIFSFLIGLERMNNNTRRGLGAIAFVLASYATIDFSISIYQGDRDKSRYEEVKRESKDNLSFVKIIVEEYFKEKEEYPKSWEVLIKFAQNDSISVPDESGTVPDRKITPDELRYLASIKFEGLINEQKTLYKANQAIDNYMSEQEAIALSKMSPVPSDLTKFKREKKRVKFLNFYQKLGNLDLEGLKYIPGSDKKEWIILVKDKKLTISGELPVAQYGDNNFEKMSIGNKNGDRIECSWEDEN